MFSSGLKISDITKTEFFELKLVQSDQKFWESYCRVDLDNVSDLSICWLSISDLTRGLLGN